MSYYKWFVAVSAKLLAAKQADNYMGLSDDCSCGHRINLKLEKRFAMLNVSYMGGVIE